MNDSSRRKDTPKVAVKEKLRVSRAQRKPGLFEAIFAGNRNLLVPLGLRKQPLAETIRNQETLTPRPPLATPRKKSVGHQERKKEDSFKRSSLIYLLTPAVALYLWFGVIGSTTKKSEKGPSDHMVNESEVKSLRERVEYYRKTVGRQINRERIGTEYANQTSAPRKLSTMRKANEPDMLNGVPLVVEKHHRVSSRDRSELANPDFSDNRVAYGLREQEQLNDFDKKAQRQYVEEFISNAAKAGYRVRVDKKGNVQVLGRGPATGSPGSLGSQLPSGPSSSGSMH